MPYSLTNLQKYKEIQRCASNVPPIAFIFWRSANKNCDPTLCTSCLFVKGADHKVCKCMEYDCRNYTQVYTTISSSNKTWCTSFLFFGKEPKNRRNCRQRPGPKKFLKTKTQFWVTSNRARPYISLRKLPTLFETRPYLKQSNQVSDPLIRGI